VLTHWRSIPLADLLAANGLDGVTEEPFPNDGWSGAGLTRLRRGDDAFVLKRTSWAVDWIARATRDHAIREAFVAGGQLPLPAGVSAPHLGSASDASTAAMLMPDLTGILLDWELPITTTQLDRVLDRLATLHATPPGPDDFPWCPIRERLELLTPHAAERYRAGGLSVGERFLAGWAAFHRGAPAAARDLVERLSVDAGPLVDALDRLPRALLHGDLKLANVGFRDGTMTLIDWQMVTAAPIAVELGWFLVSNVASLPLPPDAVLERYRDAGRRAGVDLAAWDAQVDLSWIIGLLLRGWRKGLDAEAATATGSGVSGGDDLAWWSGQAVEAASRRL
jgi:hypothetical protein